MELREIHIMYLELCIILVWIPKYIHKVFSEPYRSRLKEIIHKIGYDYNIEIVELEISMDHIHVVVRSEPKVCPSQIMQRMEYSQKAGRKIRVLD